MALYTLSYRQILFTYLPVTVCFESNQMLHWCTTYLKTVKQTVKSGILVLHNSARTFGWIQYFTPLRMVTDFLGKSTKATLQDRTSLTMTCFRRHRLVILEAWVQSHSSLLSGRGGEWVGIEACFSLPLQSFSFNSTNVLFIYYLGMEWETIRSQFHADICLPHQNNANCVYK
jgi:hypothetical protein